jgi:hypothetical protein
VCLDCWRQQGKILSLATDVSYVLCRRSLVDQSRETLSQSMTRWFLSPQGGEHDFSLLSLLLIFLFHSFQRQGQLWFPLAHVSLPSIAASRPRRHQPLVKCTFDIGPHVDGFPCSLHDDVATLPESDFYCKQDSVDACPIWFSPRLVESSDAGRMDAVAMLMHGYTVICGDILRRTECPP